MYSGERKAIADAVKAYVQKCYKPNKVGYRRRSKMWCPALHLCPSYPIFFVFFIIVSSASRRCMRAIVVTCRSVCLPSTPTSLCFGQAIGGRSTRYRNPCVYIVHKGSGISIRFCALYTRKKHVLRACACMDRCIDWTTLYAVYTEMIFTCIVCIFAIFAPTNASTAHKYVHPVFMYSCMFIIHR